MNPSDAAERTDAEPGSEVEPAQGEHPLGLPPAAVRLTIVLLCLLALLQGLAFVAGGSIGSRIVGLSIAAATFIVPTARRLAALSRSVRALVSRNTPPGLHTLYHRLRKRRIVWAPLARQSPVTVSEAKVAEDRRARVLSPAGQLKMIGGLGICAFTNLVAHLIIAPHTDMPRLLLVAVVYGYAGLGLASAVSYLRPRSSMGLLRCALVGAMALVAFEGGVGRMARDVVGGGVRWVGGTVPHPILGDHHPPGSESSTIFAQNPRGYFRTRDPRSRGWILGVSDRGSAARLIFSDALGADSARVEVERAQAPTPWHIQLSYKSLKLEKDKTYLLAFNARADPPRTTSYIEAQSSPEWKSLGQFREINVGTDWREFLDAFQSSGTSDQAQLTFNLGQRTGAFEVRGVEVRDITTDASALREPRAEYEVKYRFNDQGCRGPSYAASPAEGRRILVLGDSFALGVGVHEEDTFAARLQGILNNQSAKTKARSSYEVINCSIVGHATRQERQRFEILAPVYAPAVVVVAMTSDDDLSWPSAAQEGFAHRSSRYESLFLTWGLIQYALHEGRKPPANFSKSLQELYQLRDQCARMNAQLVVVGFRNAPLTGSWQTLTATISAGLAGPGVPWLDLGERLGNEHDWKDLVIWPGVDLRPNEVAHRSAAEQIAELLQARGLLR